MRTKLSSVLLVTLAGLGALSFRSAPQPANGGPPLIYTLDNSSGHPGTARVVVIGNVLQVNVQGAEPNTVYTVWVDYKSRATGELAADYPDEDGALERGVAPAISTVSAVYGGMIPDKNSFKTNETGSATFTSALNYDLRADGQGPVVFGELSMQGPNRVGGQWMRTYSAGVRGASVQLVSANGRPILRRATPQGITIVGHFDNVTHGLTPGVGGVDHFSAYKGDFPY